jgi:glycosyltransferase involved in cell wall biosynthesis
MNKVALIISTYNRPKALGLTLESILLQSFMPDEIIIADDGSGAETFDLIELYRNKKIPNLFHCWQKDQGFQLAKIRNKSIALSSADYIVSIDGDLILHKHFIRDHLRTKEFGCFVQGSRVLLSEKLTAQIEEGDEFPSINWFSKGIKNRLNGICFPAISNLFDHKQFVYDSINGIRGCNMAFWRKDFLAVNGFNEDITGWGREDSELVARFCNNHVCRKNLKFGGIVYHLFHSERSKISLSQNDNILAKAINIKLTRCANGINKFLN